jgi:Icc-related predicted phosphoesterase
MKLHILSDLHTEFADFSPPETGADVVILAGDTGAGLGGIEWATRQFPNQPVIYVPGNHEFFGHDITLIDKPVKQAPENIHVLNNDAIVLNGVRFLGSTLWTDFRLNGESEAWYARLWARRSMEDFAAIKIGGRAFTPEISVGLHDASRAWIASQLDAHFDGPSIVITHHLPAARSVAKRYEHDPLNPAFASSLEDLIEKYQPALWIHGHTHEPCDYELFGTRVICNPRGYPLEKRDSTFDPCLVVEVTG